MEKKFDLCVVSQSSYANIYFERVMKANMITTFAHLFTDMNNNNGHDS